MAVSEVRVSMGEAAPARERKRSSILGSLREAIRKVRFLISFSATRWMLLTSVGARRGTPRRGLSFDARPPGLLDVEGGIGSPAASSSSGTSRSASMGTATTRSLSRASSSAASPRVLTRTPSGASSSPAGDDDIDQRAEQFIRNFYEQLRMERQVSLRLPYVRGNSWDRTPKSS